MSAGTQVLAGRTVILTGALGGLGRAMVPGLLAAGANVVALDLAAAGDLGSDERLLYLSGSVTDPDLGALVLDHALARFGGVHGLVNNAGLGMDVVNRRFATDPTRFWDLSVADWVRVMEINATGPFLLARAIAPHLRAQGEGRIVNVTTSFATMQLPGFSPYGPSKAALEAATVIWSKDLAGSGVTVNALLPGGAADTPMISDREAFAGAVLVRPEAMVAPLVWLCSADSAGVTGHRFIAKDWNPALSPAAAASLAAAPAGW